MEQHSESELAGRISALYVLYLVCLSQAGEYLTGFNSVFFMLPLLGLAFLILGNKLALVPIAKNQSR